MIDFLKIVGEESVAEARREVDRDDDRKKQKQVFFLLVRHVKYPFNAEDSPGALAILTQAHDEMEAKSHATVSP